MSHDSRIAASFSRKNRGLYEPPGSKSLAESAERSSKHNREIADAIPYFQDWRQAAHEIKAYAIANLDRLLAEFERQPHRPGRQGALCRTRRGGQPAVLDIARRHGVKTVVKSKSMVSEEMELNHVLEAAGMRPVETDLGEYMVQLAGQRPVHIVTPALHMSAADVGRLFAEKLGEPFTAEHQQPDGDRPQAPPRGILQADMGISGCNFVVADTGTIVHRRERGQRRPVDLRAAGPRGR